MGFTRCVVPGGNCAPEDTPSGCATVVMIDPATGNRFAGGDPRRDCYAMAY